MFYLSLCILVCSNIFTSVTRICFPPSQTVAWAGWTWQWGHLGITLATKETAPGYIWAYEYELWCWDIQNIGRWHCPKALPLRRLVLRQNDCIVTTCGDGTFKITYSSCWSVDIDHSINTNIFGHIPDPLNPPGYEHLVKGYSINMQKVMFRNILINTNLFRTLFHKKI